LREDFLQAFKIVREQQNDDSLVTA
jgi:hypothetical protein